MSESAQRFAGLAVAEPTRLAELAERILAAAHVELLSVPGPATMLVELTESVGGQPFHLCEVAVCDAAAEAGRFRAEVEELVAYTHATTGHERDARARARAATRVDLEVLR